MGAGNVPRRYPSGRRASEREPSSPLADFHGAAGLNDNSGLAILGSGQQVSQLSPAQIRAYGFCNLIMSPRIGVEDQAATDSYFRVAFSLTEAHDASFILTVHETDAAGGATGNCAVYLDALA